ncbi:speckle-type POZ protein-like [Planococcus citri]|uniref:speckle-type POZ protein-like n=1 Tax=Planococcus citri TaxID=170843 RepID=UPI0031F7D6FB
MTNAMKMPFPKGAPVVGSIEQIVSNVEGEKSDTTTWIIPNLHYSITSSANNSLVSNSFTVSDDDGITLTWCLAIIRSDLNGVVSYRLFPFFMPENDCKEAFVNIELSLSDEGKKQFSSNVAEICRFNAKDRNSLVSLHVKGELSTRSATYCKCKMIHSNLPKFSVSKNLGIAFKNLKFTDVKLLSNDGKVLEAHRMILSASSTVFDAMFTHQMKENEQQEVKIVDMNGEVMEEMLRYIYTDKSEKLGLLTKELFVAADKYDLKGLKMMSEDTLVANLSVSNAVEILRFSEFHNATQLKTKVVKFMTTKENVEVFETDAWKSFDQINLLREVCGAFAKR